MNEANISTNINANRFFLITQIFGLKTATARIMLSAKCGVRSALHSVWITHYALRTTHSVKASSPTLSHIPVPIVFSHPDHRNAHWQN